MFLGSRLSSGGPGIPSYQSIKKSITPGIPSRQEILPTGNCLTHQEILHTGNTFPPGNPSHGEFLLIRKSVTPGIPSHQEILHTGNSFPPGNPSTGKSLTRQEILYTGNSFPPGNPSHREFLNPPRNPSHREFILYRKSFPPGISSQVRKSSIIGNSSELAPGNCPIEICLSSVNPFNFQRMNYCPWP